MKSTEKVMQVLDHSAQMSDQELTEAVPVPIPPYAVRGLLAVFADQLPQDPAELDSYLDGILEFCASLKSDHEPANT